MKRSNELAVVPAAKRARTGSGTSSAVVVAGPPRSSDLASPVMKLSGHEDEVTGVVFSASGDALMSCSADKSIWLWKVFGECETYAALTGHKNAVLDAAWLAQDAQVLSASADSTLGLWDVATGQRVRRYRGHAGLVNACCVLRGANTDAVAASVGDDASLRVWDERSRVPAILLQDKFPLFAVACGAQAYTILTAGIDEQIKVWDTRKQAVVTKLVGHEDSVTGIAVSQDGSKALSTARDNTVRVWDIRAFTDAPRLSCTLQGAKHGYERNLLRCSWSPDMLRAAAGSADRLVYVWDAGTGQVQYQLPGHEGCVNQVAFHPTQPIIASGSSDRTVYLGEILD